MYNNPIETLNESIIRIKMHLKCPFKMLFIILRVRNFQVSLYNHCLYNEFDQFSVKH